jgi:hypothetical protein
LLEIIGNSRNSTVRLFTYQSDCPMTSTRIRTSRTAYSAMSCPSSLDKILRIVSAVVEAPVPTPWNIGLFALER